MGFFLVLEGPEGAGKTSHARVLASRLTDAGFATVLTREPGGTELGCAVRSLVLPASSVPISARSEVFLYCAARAQLVEEVIRPALQLGQVVVSDRFGYSTIAYQGYGRGLDVETVTSVVRFSTDGLEPDLCILLDLDPEIGLQRKRGVLLAGGTGEWNRFEQETITFHRRVREGYLQMAGADPERWLVLDASLPFETLQDRIMQRVLALQSRAKACARRPSDWRKT